MTTTEPPRKTSATGNFPYSNPLVCYFALAEDGPVQLHYVKDRKLGLLHAAKGEITIYAVWPGRYRSDLFVVDDLAPLAAAWKAPLEDELNALQVRASRQWITEGKDIAYIAGMFSVPCSTIREALAEVDEASA